jgi:hypothetical protein
MVAALPLGWAATAHPFVGRTPAAVPARSGPGLVDRPRRRGPASEAVPRCRAGAGRTGRLSRPDQARTIVRLSRFSTQLPRAADGDLGPRRRRDPTASCAGRPARGRRQLEILRRPPASPSKDCSGPGGGGEDHTGRREQGLAGGVEVVAVVVVAEQDRVDWAEVSGGDRRAGQLSGAGAPAEGVAAARGGRRSDRSAAATAHLDQGRRAAGVGDAGCRHAPAPGACRALPSRACLTAHSRA